MCLKGFGMNRATAYNYQVCEQKWHTVNLLSYVTRCEGFDLMYLIYTALQLAYNRWLSSAAHRLGMAIGLMNNIGVCWSAWS